MEVWSGAKMSRVARVYISSTYSDLVEERLAVRDAVLRLGHHPIGMEDYGAGEQPPVTKCLDDVRSCDAYVGLVAWRYGSIPRGHGRLSFTELEYREAGRHRRPRFLYLSPEIEAWGMRPQDRRLDRVKAFRERILADHTVGRFDGPMRLRYEVGVDLGRVLGAGTRVPPLLPYLCDRHEQRRELARALAEEQARDYQAPVVCLIHGTDEQAVDRYLEWLEYEQLPAALGHSVSDRQVQGLDIPWPSSESVDAFEADLILELGQAICGSAVQDRESIAMALAQRQETVLLSTWLPVHRWTTMATRQVEAFLDFWRRWPRMPRARPLLVVICARYTMNERGWLNRYVMARRNSRVRRALAEVFAARDEAVGGISLPELGDVGRHHVDEWSRRHDVRALTERADLAAEIRAVFASNNTLAMEHVATALNAVLHRPQAQRG